MDDLASVILDATNTIKELMDENARLREALLNEQDEHSDDKLYYEERIQQITQRVNVLPPL
jgi:fructose-1,6-bisphosphatase